MLVFKRDPRILTLLDEVLISELLSGCQKFDSWFVLLVLAEVMYLKQG